MNRQLARELTLVPLGLSQDNRPPNQCGKSKGER